ncbi:MAG: hypothetical protein K6348_08205 [Deferribacterales bacterium]
MCLLFITIFFISTTSYSADVNIQDLQKRLQEKEKKLDQREKLLVEREKRVTLLENELKNKQKELEEIRATLQKLYDDIKGAEDENIDKLVKTLSNTKPKSAAAIMEKMDVEQAARVLNRMEPKKSGAIMSALGKTNPEAAAKISEKLLPPKR